MGGDAVMQGLLASGRLRQVQLLAAVGCLFTILGLATFAFWATSELYADYRNLDKLRDRLTRLDGRGSTSTLGSTSEDTESNSPFIEGATITQAGATLQQRIDRAVIKAGGSIIASQVELEDQQAKTGTIRLTVELDIAEPAIQGFLYDLEAGNPYLFVDALSVQSPQGNNNQESATMHISIGVSGQWQGMP